jgi:hypothetical protein
MLLNFLNFIFKYVISIQKYNICSNCSQIYILSKICNIKRSEFKVKQNSLPVLSVKEEFQILGFDSSSFVNILIS